MIRCVAACFVIGQAGETLCCDRPEYGDGRDRDHEDTLNPCWGVADLLLWEGAWQEDDADDVREGPGNCVCDVAG